MKIKQIFIPKVVNDVSEIIPEELKGYIGKINLIDVHRPDQFNGEIPHIPGGKLITLGSDLDSFLNSHDKKDEIVFVCRNRARSGRASLQAHVIGFSKCVSLQGGGLLWNQKKFPTEGGR